MKRYVLRKFSSFMPRTVASSRCLFIIKLIGRAYRFLNRGRTPLAIFDNETRHWLWLVPFCSDTEIDQRSVDYVGENNVDRCDVIEIIEDVEIEDIEFDA